MWGIFFILLIAIAIIMYEVPKMLRNRELKQMLFFFTLLLFGVVLSILNFLHVNIPSPILVLRFVYSPISNWIEAVLS
ncbi:hypothetical protein CIB95_01750 [Lottiidibacillus patelloidae]|uniref:Uncharacterized protein n=1 Tax=Lottiidibacillus patelloidae TaxID=2670334 RepID=A0A263BX60_9BACI|nr:hypothetical protein CIB95_01750 [Lottiidibacillus patelloidae]